jgi:hypothetical protein
VLLFVAAFALTFPAGLVLFHVDGLLTVKRRATTPLDLEPPPRFALALSLLEQDHQTRRNGEDRQYKAEIWNREFDDLQHACHDEPDGQQEHS